MSGELMRCVLLLQMPAKLMLTLMALVCVICTVYVLSLF